MRSIEVLVLHGAPGSGKSTLATEVADILAQANTAHVVIEVDELVRVFPAQAAGLKWKNVATLWSNLPIDDRPPKVIVPVLIESPNDIAALKQAIPGAEVMVCELLADRESLLTRVTEREPNDWARESLRKMVDSYIAKDGHELGDFSVRTDHDSTDQTARQIIKHMGWV